MWPVPARSSTRPDSVRLSSNDNGCKRVIKHKTDVPQASISHVPERFTVVGCWGGGTMPHLTSTQCPLSISLPAHEKSVKTICLLRGQTDMLLIFPRKELTSTLKLFICTVLE